MEQYASAFHFILVSIKFNPQNAQAYMFLGICLNEMNDPANAYNSFNKAIQLEPENHLIYLNFSIFLAGSEGEDKQQMAKQYYEKHDELFQQFGDSNDFEVKAQKNALE